MRYASWFSYRLFPIGQLYHKRILRRGSSQRSVLYTSGLLFKERIVVARDPDTVADSKVPYFKVTKLSSFSYMTVRVVEGYYTSTVYCTAAYSSVLLSVVSGLAFRFRVISTPARLSRRHLLNRPRAGPALCVKCLRECECVSV